MGDCIIIRSSGGIDTSNATAESEHILSGYTCYVNDELIIGAIPKKQLNKSVGPGTNASVPYGYYDNTNLISVSTLKEETVSSAVSSDILEVHDGWGNGTYIIGLMSNLGSIKHNLIANTPYTIPKGYIALNSSITQTLPTQSGVSVTPDTSDIIACSSSRWTAGDVVILGDSNLIAENIKNGAEIYGVRGTFIGWIDDTMPASAYFPLNGSLSASITNNMNPIDFGKWGPLSWEQAVTLAEHFRTMQISVTSSFWMNKGTSACNVYIKFEWILNANGAKSYVSNYLDGWEMKGNFSHTASRTIVLNPGSNNRLSAVWINLQTGSGDRMSISSWMAEPILYR